MSNPIAIGIKMLLVEILDFLVEVSNTIRLYNISNAINHHAKWCGVSPFEEDNHEYPNSITSYKSNRPM